MFIVYLNENYKLVTHKLIQLGNDIYCPPIEENNIIVGVYINGRKYMIKDVLTDIEIYYNIEILTNIEFIEMKHFSLRGRTFIIGILALIQVSCQVPELDQKESLTETLSTSNHNFILKGGKYKSVEDLKAVIQNEDFITLEFIDGTFYGNSIAQTMTFGNDAFYNDSSLLEVYAPMFKGYNNNCFRNAVNLSKFNIDNANYISTSGLRNTGLTEINVNHATPYFNGTGFYWSNNAKLTTFKAPNITTITRGSNWEYCPNLMLIDMPKLRVLGQTLLNENNFRGINPNCVINVSRFMETSNEGAIQGDLQYAIDLGCTVNFID